MRSIHRVTRPDLTLRRRDACSLGKCLATVVTLAACGALEPVAPYSPKTDPAALFMALTLDHRAINLATVQPYDELQLTATPRDANGAAMSGLPAPTFRSTDTTRVSVSPEGNLKAHKAGNGILVIAELVADGNIRHADTARVNVTSSGAPQMLDVLSLEPAGGDAVWPMLAQYSIMGQILFQISTGKDFNPGLTLKTLDASGVAIPGLAVEYESLDPDVVLIDRYSGGLTLRQPGDARLIARTTAYGTSRGDTAVFTVTLPLINGVLIAPVSNDEPATFTPKTLTVRPGGYVFWTNVTADSVSVTFDDPSVAGQITEICDAIGGSYPEYCDSGNIAPFMNATNSFFEHTRGRRFVKPGTYTFRIEPLGVAGKVIVTETLQ